MFGLDHNYRNCCCKLMFGLDHNYRNCCCKLTRNLTILD